MNNIISDTTWIRQLDLRREELGLTKAELARRAGLSLPTVNRFFLTRDPRPTLAVLQALASTLGLTVRIGERIEVHPTVDAPTFRAQAAHAKAERLIRMVQGTMALEAQATDDSVRAQLVQRTVHELLAGSPRRLWSEE